MQLTVRQAAGDDPSRDRSADDLRVPLLELRRRMVEGGEAELQEALRECARSDQAMREVERALRRAWDAAAADRQHGKAQLEGIAKLRRERAVLMRRKHDAHEAADAAARRVSAARLELEAAQARCKHLQAAIARHETTIQALVHSISVTEQHLTSRREVLQVEEQTLAGLRRELTDLVRTQTAF